MLPGPVRSGDREASRLSINCSRDTDVVDTIIGDVEIAGRGADAGREIPESDVHGLREIPVAYALDLDTVGARVSADNCSGWRRDEDAEILGIRGRNHEVSGGSVRDPVGDQTAADFYGDVPDTGDPCGARLVYLSPNVHSCGPRAGGRRRCTAKRDGGRAGTRWTD